MNEKNVKTNSRKSFWSVVAALAGVPLVMVLGNSMIIPVLPDIRNALNLNQVEVSLIITLFSLPAGITIPVAGFLSDRYGRKNVIIPALIAYGTGGVIAALAPVFLANKAFPLILAGRVVQGIGAAGTAPIAMTLCGDIFQGKERSRSLGAIESSNGLGKVISPVLGSAVGLISWYAAFAFFPAVVIPVIIAVWLIVREPESVNRQQKIKEYFKSFKETVKNRAGLLLASYLSGAAVLMILFGVLFFLSEYLEQRFGLDGIKKGIVLSVPVLFMSITSFITGFIIKKKKTLMKLTTVAGLATITIPLSLLPFTSSQVAYLIAFSLTGVGAGMVLPCLNMLVTSAAPTEERGLVTSLYGSVRFFGVAFGPPACGFLMTRSTGLLFWSSAALSLLACLFVLMLLKTQGRTEEQKKGNLFIFSPAVARKPLK